MQFGLFMYGDATPMADMCITSIRHHHPEDEIVHLTDMTTPQLDGTDEVRRLPFKGSMVRLRMDHLCQVEEGEFISIDTDMLVRKNLSDIFDHDFDVALTERPLNAGSFNCGIMFYRRGGFFRDLYEFMEQQHLMEHFDGMERALRHFRSPWKVRKVPAMEWNCWKMDQYPNARVMHYKGGRKRHMEQHFHQRIWE